VFFTLCIQRDTQLYEGCHLASFIHLGNVMYAKRENHFEKTFHLDKAFRLCYVEQKCPL
jgi:hypothetical protein